MRINIEGNIGSGKTTLAQVLFETLKADELILEEFENNPYLPLLYRGLDVGFQTEMFFLVARYKQYLSSKCKNGLIISDYDMLKNKIFASITIKNETEKEKFFKIYNILTDNIPKADILIYIDTSVPTIVERIKKRNRSFENQIDIEYLTLVDKKYKEYFSLLKSSDYIHIDGDNFNVFNPEEVEKLLIKIKEKMGVKKWVK
ncbi:deoxynucleoside kinase [Thermosipho ferrireducens]|uniref:Deoxynucleoside kinase n=1 Tax=Thermosipho ferrireducens TaxID=2571116 RepID=A0ABX7SA57_9BACT|nr:deoxynucleoside kinase [Thermosipho ferrireducens]QTA38296.1 deoxynucleoside kinase [Thermosipho ferrireducens]